MLLINLIFGEYDDDCRKLTPEPAVWFGSQFVKYLLRPGERLKKVFNRAKRRIDNSKPIVG